MQKLPADKGKNMTNEEIDALEGRELDRASAAAFFGAPPPCCPFFCRRIDLSLAALPDGWIWTAGMRFRYHDDNCDGAEYFASVYRPPSLDQHEARGPTPATALCRAALKAKAAEPKERDQALRAAVGSMELVPYGMTAAKYLDRNRAKMSAEPEDKRTVLGALEELRRQLNLDEDAGIRNVLVSALAALKAKTAEPKADSCQTSAEPTPSPQPPAPNSPEAASPTMSEPLTEAELVTWGNQHASCIEARAADEIRGLLTKNAKLGADIVRFNDKCVKIRRKLEADNARLRAALEKYGEHGYGCRYVVTRDEHRCRKHLKLSEQKIEPCDCGLAAALAGTDPK